MTNTRLRSWTQAAVLANLALQVIIVVTGGAVRLTGSGLGCSTWPQCEPGQFVPVLHAATPAHTYIEYGNRMIGVLLGLVGIALAVLTHLAVQRLGRAPMLRRLGIGICVGIVVQGVVGGVSVWLSLHPGIVGSHFLLSGVLLVLSTWLVVRWLSADGERTLAGSRLMHLIAAVIVLAGVLVVVLGVVVTGAGPHSGDDNVGYRFAVDPYLMARAHALAVWVFALAVLALLIVASRQRPPVPGLMRWSIILLMSTVAQGAIGYVQFFTGLPEVLVGMHLFGAAMLIVIGTRTLLTLRTTTPASQDRDRVDRRAGATGNVQR
ncbi:MAG: COX15/CtaA family protein [Beutenbergiaceae bacterium]